MKNLLYSLIFLLMMAITACGGGGSDEAATTKPDAPTNVQAMAGRGHASGVSGNYAVFSWDASSGATSYTIYYSTTDSNVTTTSSKVTGVTNTYYLYTPAPDDFKLWIAVTASNSAGESALSSVNRMAVQLAATGQTTYYITGDDGYFMKGIALPNPRYIDDGNMIFSDPLTGLMWYPISPGLYSWSSAVTYCSNLVIGGYSDWRLPTRSEMLSLMNYSLLSEDQWMWTSTPDAQNSSNAWAVNLDLDVESTSKTTGNDVFAVRDDTMQNMNSLTTAELACEVTGSSGNGVIWPSVRFVNNSSDDTFTDLLTGLMWYNNAVSIGQKSWQNALDEVAQLNSSSSHNDWRLPNIRELESLLDISRPTSPCFPSGYSFVNIASAGYWTSTYLASLSTPTSAWYINFSDGSIQAEAMSNLHYVWPVRSTQ